jgi:pyruvate dehydrogenase E1 component
MVANLSDDDIWRLNRGGHDAHKVWNAYNAAMNHKGQPTVILAKTVKGFMMGRYGESQNITHQQKKLDDEALKDVRDRIGIEITDEQILNAPFQRLPENSPEMRYLHERRKKLGGYLPKRVDVAPPLKVPPLSAFDALLQSTGDRDISTTMVFVRILQVLLKDKDIGKYIVPIVPDEARTFGMEGLFRQIGIYSSKGQLYTPQDADQLMFYKEDKKGQILEEGINEGGAISSWIAAGTAYANQGVNMVPFYIYYSMFGFQRVGDYIWAAGDLQARGFLIGGTAGRTTLAGEGLQHQDGHSLLAASTVPNCVAYDPAYAYELTVIIQDGMRRMYQERENIFYYLTCMNENYVHPAMPKGAEPGILKGMYRLTEGGKAKSKVTLLGSGTILREVEAAAAILDSEFKISADVYSVTSFSELRREALDVERWNMLHPTDKARTSYVTQTLANATGPFIASTDYMKVVADQIRQWVPGRYVVLGTDGYGRSDGRAALRRHFEVDKHYVVAAALKALVDEGQLDAKIAQAYVAKHIDADKPNPASL